MSQIRLSRLHEAQQRVLRESRRWNVVCCGRRWGKTVLGLHLAITEALEGWPIGWIGPTYKIVAAAFRDAESILAGVAEINRNERYFRLPGGGSIEMWSADSPNPARSRRYSLLIVDESSFIPNLREIWTGSLRPTLSDFRGRCYFLSTPFGLGFFHELFQRGLDPERTDWASWQMPTSSSPYIAADEIESARADLPELSFRAEYLAEFINFEGAVFRHLDRALFDVPDELRRPPQLQPWRTFQRSYCLGVDWGGVTDRTAIAVATDEMFAPTDGSSFAGLREHSPAVTIVELDYFRNRDFAVQRARLRSIWERYGRPPILAESNSIGEPVIQELRRDGIPVRSFVTSNRSKDEIVRDVVLDLERGRLRLPRDPVLIGEMSSFEATRLESGAMKYGAPSGQHDDLVMAALLARHGLVKHGGWQNNAYRLDRRRDIAIRLGSTGIY